MENSNIELYNSSYCRLCCVDCGPSGVSIFSVYSEDNISSKINKYLPIKISDDGKFPRTICSNCHVKLLTTVAFFQLVAEGQKKLLQLAQTQLTSSEFSAYGKVLQRKSKGRSRKTLTFERSEPDSAENVIPSSSIISPSLMEGQEENKGKSKRRIRLPSWFKSTLQGKDLEMVYRDVGLPDEEIESGVTLKEPLIIGKVGTKEGEDLGEVMVQPPVEENNRKQMKYRCETCGQIFDQEPRFLDHQQLHMKEVPQNPQTKSSTKKDCNQDLTASNYAKNCFHFVCDICTKTFRHFSSLTYHKETEHGDGRKYTCTQCPRSFKHRQLLKRHQIVHCSLRTHLCDICGAGFKTRGSLMNHKLVHTGVKKFLCKTCGHLFAHRTSLILHMKWHNGERPFKCDVCHKTFSQKGNLQEHTRIHTGEKPFECSICSRRFTTSSQCKLHLKRHTGERPWFCDICEKSFLNKATWKCHIRRHKGEKPYNCESCDRSFPELWALKKHRRTHTGEKPYVCSVCGKAFSDCSNLTKHKKAHQKAKRSEEDTENEQVLYLNYTDPLNPSSEVSEKFILESKNDNHTNDEVIFQVLDDLGNPMKFTLQDGTQLEVMSDGQTLEMRTLDGHTIPVSLTDSSGKAMDPVLTPVVIPTISNMGDSLVDFSTIELVTTEEEATIPLAADFLQIA